MPTLRSALYFWGPTLRSVLPTVLKNAHVPPTGVPERRTLVYIRTQGGIRKLEGRNVRQLCEAAL